VRPHPANFDHHGKLALPGLAVWPRPPFPFQDGVPETNEAIREFLLALRPAVATIGINTSAMMEAVILDCPCIALEVPKYESTTSKALHFQHLVKADVLYRVRSATEGVAELARIVGGQDLKGPQRKAFQQQFVRPYGRALSAGWVQSRAIEEMAKGKRAAAVVREVAAAARNEGVSYSSLESSHFPAH